MQQSDKEFDKLFYSRFESFECEPSDAVWTAISNKLEKKKAFPRFWTAAASIVLVLGAAFWLMKPKETIRLYGGEEITDNRRGTAAGQAEFEKQDELKEPARQKISKPAPPSNLPEKSIVRSAKAVIEEPKQNMYSAKPDTEDEIKPAVKTPADGPPPLQIESPAVTADTAAPVLAAAGETANAQAEKSSASMRDIKTVGGLVNFIVEKVDKRDQKLIEFTDTDEGSFVSGINLGFVKFKNNN